MKKLILTLAVAVSSIVAFAGEENTTVSSEVLNAFYKEFSNAKDVKWTTSSNYYKAEFVFNKQYVFAFYSLDGDLLGVTRNITSLDLPVKLQLKLKKKYPKYWISDLFELSNDHGTSYYVTLEDADKKIVLKSTGNNGWEVYRTTTKV